MSKIIWDAELDNRYKCTVKRLDERKAVLTVVDTTNEETLLDREVGLSYGAMFGPDMMDVADWQTMIIEAVDGKK